MSQPHAFSFHLSPGQVLGERFEVSGERRQGGLSVAFRAIDRQNQEPVELQLFPLSLFEAGEEASEFAASWEPWLEVESPHLVGVREVVAYAEAGLLLVTDPPRGTCMRTYLEESGPLEEAQVIDCGLQLLAGLNVLHDHGLVHGDLKPLTIFVEPDGARLVTQLADGGTTHGLWTAKGLGERTALIGTPYYAPVEQFGGDAPTVQSDVYNLATVLFELATGVQPWAGKSFLEVFQSKLERTPPTVAQRAPRAKVSKALEEAIRGGLFAAREQRYPSCEAFRQALEQCA
jgi:serine/threonine protein kinase